MHLSVHGRTHICDNRCVFQRRDGGALQPANIYMQVQERVRSSRAELCKAQFEEKTSKHQSFGDRKVCLTVAEDQSFSEAGGRKKKTFQQLLSAETNEARKQVQHLRVRTRRAHPYVRRHFRRKMIHSFITTWAR